MQGDSKNGTGFAKYVLPMTLSTMSTNTTILINGFNTGPSDGQEKDTSLPSICPAICKTFFDQYTDPPAARMRQDEEQHNTMMTAYQSHPEIRGTRTGYVIRYTCPSCATESIIVSKSPRDHFKNARVVSCKNCRKRLNVLTPGREC
jgi:hypothetical protein